MEKLTQKLVYSGLYLSMSNTDEFTYKRISEQFKEELSTQEDQGQSLTWDQGQHLLEGVEASPSINRQHDDQDSNMERLPWNEKQKKTI